MSRYYDWLETVTPEEYPEPFSPRDREDEMPLPKWRAEDVPPYRAALANLGFSGDALEDQIEKDCGREFSLRPMFSRKQAE